MNLPNWPANLTNQILQQCPIDGISIGDPNDKSTWIIRYKKETTNIQMKLAQSLVDTYIIDNTFVKSNIDILNDQIITLQNQINIINSKLLQSTPSVTPTTP